MTEQERWSRAEFDVPSICAPALQEPPHLVVAQPLVDAPARGLAVIQYRADNLRIIPVYGPALNVVPRIGHIHVTLDDGPMECDIFKSRRTIGQIS